jgi:hypothetical protein
MSHSNEIHLQTQVGVRHQDGRHVHYPSLSQDDRIRRVFGLSEGARLPSVNDQSLGAYYNYLIESLAMPFDALYCPPAGGDSTRQLIHYVHVVELTDPRPGLMHNNLHGLFCKAQNAKQMLDLSLADLGVREDNPNCQLIDDYAYWFVNGR